MIFIKVGHIPDDVVRDMADIAPMLSVLGYDPYANPPDYGKADSWVQDNTKRVCVKCLFYGYCLSFLMIAINYDDNNEFITFLICLTKNRSKLKRNYGKIVPIKYYNETILWMKHRT